MEEDHASHQEQKSGGFLSNILHKFSHNERAAVEQAHLAAQKSQETVSTPKSDESQIQTTPVREPIEIPDHINFIVGAIDSLLSVSQQRNLT